MFCSLLPRNFLLISGVVISHVCILIGLLSGPFSGKESSAPGILTVNLADERAAISASRKSPTKPQLPSFSDQQSQSSIQADTASMKASGADTGPLAGGAYRRAIYSPKPHYPLASRRLKEQGLVVVKLCVNEQGVVHETGVFKSSGFQNLDLSALKALALWRFSPPPSSASSSSSQCFQTPVQFSLEG